MPLSSKMRLSEAKVSIFRAVAGLALILALLIDVEIVKTKTSFWKILGKSLNNNLFYYTYNTLSDLHHLFPYSNGFNLYFFSFFDLTYLVQLHWFQKLGRSLFVDDFGLIANLSPGDVGFFFILPSLVEAFSIVQVLRNWGFQTFSLIFFRLRIFCWLCLVIGLGRGDVHLSITPVVLLVNVAAGKGLYLSFSFNFIGLFDQDIPAI